MNAVIGTKGLDPIPPESSLSESKKAMVYLCLSLLSSIAENYDEEAQVILLATRELEMLRQNSLELGDAQPILMRWHKTVEALIGDEKFREFLETVEEQTGELAGDAE